jgi:hypothetical protein
MALRRSTDRERQSRLILVRPGERLPMEYESGVLSPAQLLRHCLVAGLMLLALVAPGAVKAAATSGTPGPSFVCSGARIPPPLLERGRPPQLGGCLTP